MQKICAFLIKPLFVGGLISLLTISCSSVPKQINLKRTSISQIRSIVVTVKIPNPKVIHERMVSDIPPTGVPLVHLIDSAISLSKDETHSESARNAIDVMDLKNILGNHFVENIRHANLFNEIVYFPNQPDDNRKQFFREKYYAVLEIDIRDLSFVRTGDGNLCLYIDIRGTMIKQDDKEILWSRQETIRSKETYTLAFVTTYSDELRKVFYQTFQSLAERLAADFLYLE